jgi:hypothetical protein
MTAPRDCRPPEDTPDVLDLPIRLLATWHTRPWWRGGSYWTLPHIIQFFAPRRMRGYRFHSIAEPPHE